MRKKQKQLHRIDDIHKPKPFLRFRLRVVIAFFIICMLACLVYYMILANADASHIIIPEARQKSRYFCDFGTFGAVCAGNACVSACGAQI